MTEIYDPAYPTGYLHNDTSCIFATEMMMMITYVKKPAILENWILLTLKTCVLQLPVKV